MGPPSPLSSLPHALRHPSPGSAWALLPGWPCGRWGSGTLSLDCGLGSWSWVRVTLCSPQGPSACRALSQDSLSLCFQMPGGCLAHRGRACPPGSLDPCGEPQPAQGQVPGRAEGQPGPASEMRFFYMRNFSSLSPLKSLFMCLYLY